MNIRETLIKLRSDSNLSQQEFAEKLDVSRQTVSRWEAGRSVPSSAQISKICKTFRLDANELLSGGGNLQCAEADKVDENFSDEQIDKKGRVFDKRKTAAVAAAGLVLLIALAGMIVTIVYAVKDAMYDSSATVWIVEIPNNTPMIILSVFLALFIIILTVFLVYLLRGRKK